MLRGVVGEGHVVLLAHALKAGDTSEGDARAERVRDLGRTGRPGEVHRAEVLAGEGGRRGARLRGGGGEGKERGGGEKKGADAARTRKTHGDAA